jgi:hypothetical protein
LLDENRKTVTPGTTFLARNVFSDAGLSYVSRMHWTWDMNPHFISDIILWEAYQNDPRLKEIANRAKEEHKVKDGFWISGSGGAASNKHMPENWHRPIFQVWLPVL